MDLNYLYLFNDKEWLKLQKYFKWQKYMEHDIGRQIGCSNCMYLSGSSRRLSTMLSGTHAGCCHTSALAIDVTAALLQETFGYLRSVDNGRQFADSFKYVFCGGYRRR